MNQFSPPYVVGLLVRSYNVPLPLLYTEDGLHVQLERLGKFVSFAMVNQYHQ